MYKQLGPRIGDDASRQTMRLVSELNIVTFAAPDGGDRLTLTQEWSVLVTSWEEAIIGLNKDIATLNLKQPGGRLEILKLAINGELKRAGASRILG